MKHKFKVGDKVKIISDRWEIFDTKVPLNLVWTIEQYNPDGNGYFIINNNFSSDYAYHFYEAELRSVNSDRIKKRLGIE